MICTKCSKTLGSRGVFVCCGIRHQIKASSVVVSRAVYSQQNRIDEKAFCVYRGQPIADLDCRCGGNLKAYQCNLLSEPCIVRPTGKPWISIKSTPPIEFEPITCSGCECNTKPGEDLIPITLPKEHLPTRTSDRLVLVIAANDWAKQQYAITGQAIERYAERCEADFHLVTNDLFPWFPMLNKWRITSFAKHWVQTLYLDCDVIIRDAAPNIFESVPIGKWGLVNEAKYIAARNYFADLVAVADRYGYAKPDWCPNAGVMVIPQGCEAYEPPKGKVPSQWCLDQSWLACRLSDYHPIDSRYNWMAIQPNFEHGLDSAWFVHLNGTTRDTRLGQLATLRDRLAHPSSVPVTP
jgi:hypothetical protein